MKIVRIKHLSYLAATLFSWSFFITAADAADNVYRSKEHGFSITFPQNWQIKKNEKDIVLGSNPAEGNTANINILVKPLPPESSIMAGEDLVDYLSTQQLIPGWDTIKDSGEAELGGQKALWMKALTPLTSGDNTLYVASSQIWTVHAGKLFSYTCVAMDKTPEDAQEKFRRNEKYFTTAAASLRFSGPDSSSDSAQTKIWTRITLLFLMVFVLELAIPLLTRLTLIKKPLDPLFSGIGALMVFLANVGIFTALGSKTRFNPLFFLFALTAYLIFNAGYRHDRNQ
jgi:hypothetical protein